jgi:putative methionine-R-sulfoxide reductase with GAF domain
MKFGELGRIYEDGETVCREGDTGDCMYVIQSGKASVSKKSAGEEMFIRTLYEGEIFGETALFTRLPRSATVRADGKVRILRVDKNKFIAGVSDDPSLAFMIIKSMCSRIVDLTEKLSTFKKNREKLLAAFSHKAINEACRKILDQVQHSIPSDNGSIMLISNQDDVLRIEAAFGMEAQEKIELKAGNGIAGNVLTTGEVELVDNIGEDTRFIPGQMSFDSLLCAPVMYRKEPLGVINLSKRGVHAFGSDDVKLMKVLSVYASTALENARLYCQTGSITEPVVNHATLC